MFNINFKNNWLKILDYNKKTEIIDKLKPQGEILRIPMSPLEVDGYIIYNLFKLLYPKFISDQQNTLDLILSDDDTSILNAYLYQTKIPGIFQSYQKLPNDFIKSKKLNLEDLRSTFNNIQSTIKKRENTRISSIRFFKKEAIDFINNFCNSIENMDLTLFHIKILDLIQDLITKNLFFLYPKPNIIEFLEKLFHITNGIRLSSIFDLLFQLLPEMENVLILNSNIFDLIILIKKNKKDLEIKLHNSLEYGIEKDKLSIPEFLNLVKKKFDYKNVYFLNLDDLISFLIELFEMEFPPRLDFLELMCQKFFFAIRNFENSWYKIPKPKIYNTLRRFLVRLLSINLNPKKISHWQIPNLFFTLLKSDFGLNHKILIILTDLNRLKKNKNKNTNFLKNSFKSCFLIDIKQKTIKNIIPIDINKVLSETIENDNKKLRLTLSKEYGFISQVINLDISIIKNILKNSPSDLSKLRPFSRSKILKLLKNKHYFNMEPESPIFKTFKDSSNMSFVKLLLPIFIDKHEF